MDSTTSTTTPFWRGIHGWGRPAAILGAIVMAALVIGGLLSMGGCYYCGDDHGHGHGHGGWHGGRHCH